MKLLFSILLFGINIFPSSLFAQLSVRVGRDFGGAYRTKTESLSPSSGLLLALEISGGENLWNAGIGAEHLFKRKLADLEGSFAYTAGYVFSQFELEREFTPLARIRFGWTIAHRGGEIFEPTNIIIKAANPTVQISGNINYGASLGLRWRSFQIEAAYVRYQTNLRIRAFVLGQNLNVKSPHRYAAFFYTLRYTLPSR